MDMVFVLIGFVCGFICRQVILYSQIRQARKEFATFLEQQRGEQNGDSK